MGEIDHMYNQNWSYNFDSVEFDTGKGKDYKADSDYYHLHNLVYYYNSMIISILHKDSSCYMKFGQDDSHLHIFQPNLI